MSPSNTKFRLSSSAFEDGKVMPTKYAHQGVLGGQNVSVPLKWENPPAETKSFTLSCIDPHPVARNWVHWFVINIPKDTRELSEGASLTGGMPRNCKELYNSYGELGYGGPEPPKGSGPHPYEFTLYALNVERLDLGANTSLSAFLKAIDEKVLMAAKIIGIFER